MFTNYHALGSLSRLFSSKLSVSNGDRAAKNNDYLYILLALIIGLHLTGGYIKE